MFTDTPVPLPLRVADVPLFGTLVFGLLVGNRFGLRLLHRAPTENRGVATWSRFQRHLAPSAMATTRRIFQRSPDDSETDYAGVERSLADVAIPALALWGDSDPFFSTDVAERTRSHSPSTYARTASGAKRGTGPETGHQRWWTCS